VRFIPPPFLANTKAKKMKRAGEGARLTGLISSTVNLAQKTLHATGLWRDKRLEEYEHSSERAWRSYHRLAVRRRTLIGQLAVNGRLAATALDKIRLEAERVLSQRQHEAETARGLLAAIRETRPPIRARTNARARPRLKPLVGGPGPATGVAVIPFRA
jgi:hypothetical protein